MDDFFKKLLNDAYDEADKKITEDNISKIAGIGAPVFAMYASFVESGFTKAQALDLTKTLLVSCIGTGVKR